MGERASGRGCTEERERVREREIKEERGWRAKGDGEERNEEVN